MKFRLACLGVFFSCFAAAQCGTAGDTLFVESVADLEALSTCTHILGSLQISENAISDVAQLSALETVEEHLLLFDNTSILGLGGLGALTSIGGNFELVNNFTLQNLDGLENLASVGGDFLLEGNITLVHFDALAGCSFNGSIRLLENHTLQQLDGLAGTTHLSGDLVLDPENLILDDLSGLLQLESIAGDCHISLPKLLHCQGLAGLEEVGGLYLQNMPLLGNLEGLESMQMVADSLVLRGNNSLVNLNALAGLDGIGNASVTQNPALMWCCAAANWDLNQAIEGNVVFDQNHTNCTGFEQIVEDCEPLGVAALSAEFEPGAYTVRCFDLSGRLEWEESLWLTSNADAYSGLTAGVHLVVLCNAQGDLTSHLVLR